MRDTDPDTERRLAEAWLERGPGERLRRVFELNDLVDRLADAGLRARGESVLTPREMREGRAALSLDREMLAPLAGRDPDAADR